MGLVCMNVWFFLRKPLKTTYVLRIFSCLFTLYHVNSLAILFTVLTQSYPNRFLPLNIFQGLLARMIGCRIYHCQ